MSQKETQNHRSREETRAILLHLFSVAPRPLSRSEVARALKRSKSPNVTSLLEELVAEGILERGVRTYFTGVQGYEYWRKS